MDYSQLDFLNDLDLDEKSKLIGTAEKIREGYWIAKINGGWWFGSGKTKKAAINSALRTLKNEIEKYGMTT